MTDTFRASGAMRAMGVVWTLGSGALSVYGLGSALGWWGGRICYQSCDAGDTPGFWWVVAVGMAVATAVMVTWTFRMFTDRTEVSADGIRTMPGGSTTELDWASIERFDLVGRPGFPAQVHAVTADRSVRLRGVDVTVDGSRGRSIEPFATAVEERSGRSIPIGRNG